MGKSAFEVAIPSLALVMPPVGRTVESNSCGNPVRPSLPPKQWWVCLGKLLEGLVPLQSILVGREGGNCEAKPPR